MVLYKRKPVTLVRPLPLPQDPNAEIYIIPQTKEWFLDYEDYLARMDYYQRRKFVCEITGNSCLTFFDAYSSELKEIKDVEQNFPEALKEHILRFLQFNRITRLDQLVDKVYQVFKSEYFPGEEVFVRKAFNALQMPPIGLTYEGDDMTPTFVSTVRQKGVIREKVQYSNSDTKFLVSTLGDGQQIIATRDQISRDRNNFTKFLVKTFVKLSVTRSHKVGAPWVVKEKFAKKYRIPQVYPDDLKAYELLTPSGETLFEDDGWRMPSDERKRKSPKKKAALNAATSVDSLLNDAPRGPRDRFPRHHLPPVVQSEMDDNDVLLAAIQPSKRTTVADMQLGFDLQNTKPMPRALELPANGAELHQRLGARLRAEILQLEEDVESLKGDELAALTEELARKRALAALLALRYVASVLEALEAWAFLNIYHAVLKIDTFTFDDFLVAMCWNSRQLEEIGRCELLDEIWCAVLGAIVSLQLPKHEDSDSEDEHVFGLQVHLPSRRTVLDNDSESDEPKEEEEKPEPPPPKKRGRKPKGWVPPPKEESDVEEEPPKEHNAAALLNYKGVRWHQRLRKRQFKDGLWQTSVLGVLSMVSYAPEFKPVAEQALRTLAPLSVTSPAGVLKEFYGATDVNLRFRILHALTSLLVGSAAVRNYIDEAMETSTALRRSRIDLWKEYKTVLDAAGRAHSALHEKLLEAAMSGANVELFSTFSRKRPRLNVKGYTRTEYDEWMFANDPQYPVLWDEREGHLQKLKQLKEERKQTEMKLSEFDCQRVRLLGKDRLCNRYWWFENNGLPNLQYSAGDDDEDVGEDDEEDDDDVEEETYLMGMLWVQGPGRIDQQLLALAHEPREPCEFEAKPSGEVHDVGDGGRPLVVMNFDWIPESFRAYAEKHGVRFHADKIEVNDCEAVDRLGGVTEEVEPGHRKLIEEAPDPLVCGSQWRFYSESESIDRLIGWLNPWGRRELQLRKELEKVREALVASIAARRKALWMDGVPKEDITANMAAVDAKLEELPKGANESDEEPLPKKRRSAKDERTTEELIAHGSVHELERLQAKLKDDLAQMHVENKVKRVLEWVNALARDEYDKLLYDGGGRAKAKGRRLHL